MAHRHFEIDYAVHVEGRFVAPGIWMVHADVAYRPHLGFETRRRVAPDARIELLRGVSREIRHGWDRGARSVRVHVEGDHQVAGMFEVRNGDAAPAIVA